MLKRRFVSLLSALVMLAALSPGAVAAPAVEKINLSAASITATSVDGAFSPYKAIDGNLAADADGKGVVTASDALMILQYAAGKIEAF